MQKTCCAKNNVFLQYHAALALLAQAGYRSKSHMASLCGIILHYYHKNKILEKKHIEILRQINRENIEQFIEAQNLGKGQATVLRNNFL